MPYLWGWEEVDPKPKVSGLSQAVELAAMHPLMWTSSLWLASKVQEMQHRLFLPGGGKLYTRENAQHIYFLWFFLLCFNCGMRIYTHSGHFWHPNTIEVKYYSEEMLCHLVDNYDTKSGEFTLTPKTCDSDTNREWPSAKFLGQMWAAAGIRGQHPTSAEGHQGAPNKTWLVRFSSSVLFWREFPACIGKPTNLHVNSFQFFPFFTLKTVYGKILRLF